MKKILVILFLGVFLISCISAISITGGAVDVNESKGNQNSVQAADKSQIEAQTQTTAQVQNQERERIKKAIVARNRLKIREQTGECPENCNCDGSSTKCQFRNGTKEITIMAGKSGNIIVQTKNVNMSTKVELYKSEDGEIYGVFKDNETRRIKILPDEIREKVQEKLRTQLENGEIELDEDGNYHARMRKRARLFGLIPVREKVITKINSETGEIIRTRTSWWGFLARDIKDELVGTTCATVSPDSRGECCINKGFDTYNEETLECEDVSE